MYCKSCGKNLNDNAKFCSACGTIVNAGADKAQDAQPQPSQVPPQAPPQAQPQYQQPQQFAQTPPPAQQYQQPGYQQPGYQQAQYGGYAVPAQKKSKKKPLIGIASGVAAVLVFLLVILPVIKGPDIPVTPSGPATPTNIEIYIDVPGGRDIPFEPGEIGFTTDDPSIKMIEVNQGLSYGFDTDSGEFYLMENFVAGKETAIFIDLEKPVDPRSEVKLKIERNGELVATMSEAELIDDHTLLFQPRNISEVGFWDQGYYALTFEMDDSVAVRNVNFFKSMPIKALAVPIKGNYSGDIRTCVGDWQQSSTMITATYPVAREDVDYKLGPELDLSDPMFDLDTQEGQFYVWEALTKLQTPDDEYDIIIGFMRTPTTQGFLGYTYGSPATIVCESEPDLLATVVHEIAHIYKIGDEYEGGHLNNILNAAPYQMRGYDIITREPTFSSKEHVSGGNAVGLNGTGSVIYPEQRPYWVEGRQLLGTVTSYMGGGTGEDSWFFWTTSDIWNHIFNAYTGQLAGNEPGFGTAGDPNAGSGTATEDPQGEYWGQCFQCYGDVFSPMGFIECTNCGDFVLINNQDFRCDSCGTSFDINNFTDNDLWIYHPDCEYMLWFPDFAAFNSGSGKVDMRKENQVTAIKIKGNINGSGVFTPSAWYVYETPQSSLTANVEGEYSVVIYDGDGKQISVAYFNDRKETQFTTSGGTQFANDRNIPVDVSVKLPANAETIVIKMGDKELYKKELSKNAPVVSFTGLTEGQELANNTTLTWEASDTDGDALTSEIWYYRSEEERFLVATGITGASYNADLTDFPGTDQGWFEIYTTDGIRTGTDISPLVSVPYKAPVILNDLGDKTKFNVTDIVEISAEVYDAQDGWLWYGEGMFEWKVDGKIFDNGGSFYFWQSPYMLKPGPHTITLTATNSAGLSTSKDFVIEIIEDESALPDDWSRNDITLALRLGFYQPLARLESPVTRLEYAKMMFSMYSLTLPDDFEQLPDFVTIPMITDMNNDLNDMNFFYAFFMVGIGLMDAPDGVFDPHGSITEREAMQIMYKTIELSKNQTVTNYSILDESEFIPALTEMGLFNDTDGHNLYQAGEKISKKLTMVRIARFIKYEFEMEDKDYGIDAGFFDNYYKD